MRNLKRVLSLVLAMVMLFGMMMVPTNAADTFADADEIVNKKAVQITAGMGLFAGSDGKFNPQGNVTRAQMATIIVKMLRGANFAANPFKGAGNPFSDTASFEGGWAEGYINVCFQMGIIKGYGDGTFKPGNSVTTAEAVTMIINALKVDAGAGEWPMTVMSKANEMKLFGDLNPVPATNTALIRDQLAVITLEGLNYSESVVSGVTGEVNGATYTFDSYTAAVKAGATNIKNAKNEDALASTVYKMNDVSGYVTENQAVGADYTMVGDIAFDAVTGLDLIGHWVTVYYKVPAEGEHVDAYETYAVVDESTVVIVAEDIEDSSKEYNAAFGKKVKPASKMLILDSNYAKTDKMGGAVEYIEGSHAPKGAYIIYKNEVVAFLQPTAPVASQIKGILEFDGEKSYVLAGEADGGEIEEEYVTVYGGAKQGDYVTFTKAGEQYVLSPVDPVKGTASKVTTNAKGEVAVIINGVAYPMFDEAYNQNKKEDLDRDLDGLKKNLNTQYTFYITQDGQVIGWVSAAGATSTDVNVDDIVYALGTFSVETSNSSGAYGSMARKHYLQGVNTKGEEAHVLLAVEYDNDGGETFEVSDPKETLGSVPSTKSDDENFYKEGFYILKDFEDADDTKAKNAKKEGVKVATFVRAKDDPLNDTGLFYGMNRYGSTGENTISWPNSFANNHVCSTKCTYLSGASTSHNKAMDTADPSSLTTRTFFTPDTQFVMIHGELGGTLKTKAGGSDFKWTLPSGEGMKHPMLYRQNGVDATEIVMIAIRKDPDDLSAAATSVIYVDSDKPVGTSEAGDLYEVYIAASGKKQEVVLKGVPKDGKETAPLTGFWRYKEDEEGAWVQSTRYADPDNLGHDASSVKELYFNGLFDGKTVSATRVDGGELKYITGADGSSAKVVDLRTEAQKKASGVSTITSVAQLDNLADNMFTITCVIYNKSKYTTGCIYVKDVVKAAKGVVFLPVDGGAVAYDLNGNAMSSGISRKTGEIGFVRIEDLQTGGVGAVAETDEKYYVALRSVDLVDGTLNATKGADGVSLKVDETTKIFDLTGNGLDDLTALGEMLKQAPVTFSAICEKDQVASVIFVTVAVPTEVLALNGKYVWIDSALLKTSTAGKVNVKVEDENGEYTKDFIDFPYSSVAVAEDMITTGGAYYKVTISDADGSVKLTRACNYLLQPGDVLYIISTLNAGSTETGIIAKSNTAAVGDQVYFVSPSGDGTKYWNYRMARVTSEGKITIHHIASTTKYMAGLDYKLGWHEPIKAVDTKAQTITMGTFDSDVHKDKTTCNWCNACTTAKYTGEGYLMSSYGAAACEGTLECGTVQKYDENTKFVDLRDYKWSGTAVKKLTVETFAELVGDESVMIDIFVPDGDAEKGVHTASLVVVLPVTPKKP